MNIQKMIRGVVLSAFALTAGSTFAADTVVVGGKNFTEQQLMAEMTSQLLKAKGFEVDTRAGMGSAVLRQAQESGQIDVYWEYTGTSLITYNKVTERLSAEDTYAKVKELDAKKGLTWLDASKANNTYGLAMRRADAKKRGINTISELAAAINGGKSLTLACNAEFAARADGLKPLQKAYGFEFDRASVKRMDTGLTYQALRDDQVEVALVFVTDGRIPAFDFVVLKDDKGYFPAYALTPVVRTAILEKHPKLGELLNALSSKLDDAVMGRLNASVDVERKAIRDVAEGFLKEAGLI
ncbi:glycine/betaine ABC transporter substrate-binding protein [Parazoarcus communis]|uniref:Glycine/betaine ABC transporter substrate-binding protein n=1 Tax=Parazoarcus communis TaxID=41977 RepID=A0A2U8H544_9RHOO|nr:glycine betaine ABC transporter substrate-binding protein [Parazoarcus communis]AWI80630.1 glycine/betaine ABC transporter substrate-binding protein [Parazoarcus communis]